MPRITIALTAALAVTVCSCTASPRVSQIDSPAHPSHNHSVELRGQSPDSDSPSDEGVASTGVARLGRRTSGPVRPVANFTPAEPRVPSAGDPFAQPAGHFVRRTQPDGTTFYGAESRGPVDCPTDTGTACVPGSPCATPGYYPGWAGPPNSPINACAPAVSLPRLYPDEYLCDGGDRDYPVHYDENRRLGLDTEDTIAEYVDSNGTFRMKPSTRVCVYAPRFGAMRTASGPEAGTSIHRLASASETTYGAGLRNRDAVIYHNQRQGGEGLLVRSRPSGIDADAIGRGAHQSTVVASHTKLINTFEDLMFLRTGQFLTGEEPWIAKGVQAAMVWTRAENPVIAANTTGGQELRAKFRAAEIVGTEDRRKPGVLRICKLADTKVAVPGDVITFTIRYDNLGDLPVSQVRIVDNLTPRLEYVADSGTSDRAGEITVEDNEEGSSILTIELDEPLKGRTGGVITFQAKVR